MTSSGENNEAQRNQGQHPETSGCRMKGFQNDAEVSPQNNLSMAIGNNDQTEYEQMLALFEHMPGVCFFVKDRDGNYLAANQNMLIRFGLAAPEEIIGQSDEAFNSCSVAGEYRNDEIEIIKSGQPLIDRVTPLRTEMGGYEWSAAAKFPLRQTGGEEITGVYGTYRPLEGAGPIAQNPRIAEAIRWLDRNMGHTFRIEDLADELRISKRQLQRIFRKEVMSSVTEFVAKSRVMKAAELLISGDEKIADIALEVGFCDQSVLNRNFRKHLGCTPKVYRSKLQK